MDVVRQLIAAKARTHVVDAEGLTPLHEAANNGDPDLVRLLLSHGARVSHVAHSSGATVSLCLCPSQLRFEQPTKKKESNKKRKRKKTSSRIQTVGWVAFSCVCTGFAHGSCGRI